MKNGMYEIIDTFVEGHAKAEVGEDIFEFADGHGMSHEVGLSVGHVGPIWLKPEDIDDVIRVLYQAKVIAEKRAGEFYQEDEILSPR